MPTLTIAATTADLIWEGYEALLFDWDGTLVDSHAANFIAMRNALVRQGLDLAPEWYATRTGMSSRDMVTAAGECQSRPVDVEQAATDRDAEYLRLLHLVETITPINKVLNDAHRNVRTALATGGGADTVGATVDALGMRGLFDVIVTRNDVARGKPAPDIFLAAAQRLDVDPARVLVFEDSDEGLQAADAAGMDAIDVRPLRPTFGVDVTALEGRRTMRPVNPQS